MARIKSNAVVWGSRSTLPDEAMPDSMMVDYMIRQLNKEHDKPFYLGVGFRKPHMPWSVPRKYTSTCIPWMKFRPPSLMKTIGMTLALRDAMWLAAPHTSICSKQTIGRKRSKGYLATCTYTDVQVGRLMEAFDKSAYKDNTIIVLWSDHGWHLGDKGHWKKFALWEETTHVPMLIVAPGITKPEQKCDRVVGSIDLYPTLLDLCGFEPNNTLDGQSLVPLLKDPAKDWDHPVLTTHSRGYDAIRTAKWRYIQYPKDGEAELYDRINDPLEHNNLIKNPEYAAVIAELKAHIPTEQAEEVVQVAKVVIQVQTKLLNRKKKIAGPTYYDAQKRVNDAVLACEPGEEEAVARALATKIFTKAIADGVYDPENLEKPRRSLCFRQNRYSC